RFSSLFEYKTARWVPPRRLAPLPYNVQFHRKNRHAIVIVFWRRPYWALIPPKSGHHREGDAIEPVCCPAGLVRPARAPSVVGRIAPGVSTRGCPGSSDRMIAQKPDKSAAPWIF